LKLKEELHQKVEKAEQAKLFDKQTNKKANKQTNKNKKQRKQEKKLRQLTE